MTLSTQIILVQPLAPHKPMEGAVCNGCGLCCLVEPCPLGVVLSRKRTGACDALRWHDEERIYRCGAVSVPLQVARQVLPGYWRGVAPALAWVLGRLALRWIAAGHGCDSSLVPESAASQTIAADLEPGRSHCSPDNLLDPPI